MARDFNFDEHEFDGSKALLPPTPYLFGKSKRVVEDTDVVKSLIAMESSPEIRKTEEDDMKKEGLYSYFYLFTLKYIFIYLSAG